MQVVKQFKQFNGSSYTPYDIGAEQRFIGALRASNNNNLEEQLLLGPDCITQRWTDNNKTYVVKTFWNGQDELTEGCYSIETVYDYIVLSSVGQFGIITNGLEYTIDPSIYGIKLQEKDDNTGTSYGTIVFENGVITPESKEELSQLLTDNTSIFIFQNGTTANEYKYIINPPSILSRTDTLYFNKNNKKYFIAKKEIFVTQRNKISYDEDGNISFDTVSNLVETTQEKIIRNELTDQTWDSLFNTTSKEGE